MNLTYKYLISEPSDQVVRRIKNVLNQSRIYHNKISRAHRGHNQEVSRKVNKSKRAKLGYPQAVVDDMKNTLLAEKRKAGKESLLWWPQKKLIENRARQSGKFSHRTPTHPYTEIANYPNPAVRLSSMYLPSDESFFGIDPESETFWFTYSKPQNSHKKRFSCTEMNRCFTKINLTREIPETAIIRYITIEPNYGKDWILKIHLEVPDGFLSTDLLLKEVAKTEIIINPVEITLPDSDLRVVMIGGPETSGEHSLQWPKRLAQRWLYSYRIREQMNEITFKIRALLTEVYFPDAEKVKSISNKFLPRERNITRVDSDFLLLEKVKSANQFDRLHKLVGNYRRLKYEFDGLLKSCHRSRRNLYQVWAKRLAQENEEIKLIVTGVAPRRTAILTELIPVLEHQCKKHRTKLEIDVSAKR